MIAPLPSAPRQPPDRPARRAWDRGEYLVLFAILITGVWLGWALRFPAVLTGGDDLTYLLLSRAIAAGSYRDIWLLGEPLHALYPPIMPVWVWILSVVPGGALGTIQAGNLLLLAVTATLTGDAVRRLGFARFGVAVVGLVMFNPVLLRMAGTAVAESMLVALSTGAMWAMLRADQAGEAHRRQWTALAVCFTLAAFLTKTVGVAVVAGVVVALMVRSRWRSAAVAMIASGLVVGAWLEYVRRAGRATIGSSYLADLSVGHAGAAAGGLTGRVLYNARYYVQEGLPDLLGLYMVPLTPWDNLAWSLVLLPSGLVGAIWLVRRWPMAPLVMAGTLGILLLWPWGITRLAAPLVPLAVTMFVIGATIAGRHIGALRGGWVASAGIVLALGLSLSVRLHRDWTTMRECPRPDPYGTASPCTSPIERALVAGARAAEAHLPASAVIATSKPQVVYWFGRRRTAPIGQLRGSTPSTLLAAMHRLGATHVLLSRMHPVEYRDLAAAFAGACRDLTPAAPVPGPAVLLAPRVAGEPDACEAIARVLSWQAPDS